MKKTFQILSFCVSIVLCAGLFSGCTTYDHFMEGFFGAGDQSDAVHIAVYEPMTGIYSDEAEAEIIGIQLANELYPEVLDKPVELVYADNASNLDSAKTALENLVEQKPAVVLGSYGSAFSMLGGEYFMEAGIPAITITNTNPLVNSNNPFYFRVCFVEAYQGRALADFTVKSLKKKSVAVLQPVEDDQAIALSTAFSDRMEDLTKSSDAIAAFEEYTAGDSDFQAQLAAIQSSGADVVFLPGGNEDTLKIMTKAKEAGMNLTFLGTEAWNDDVFIQEILAAGIGNFYFPSEFAGAVEQSDYSEALLAAYKDKYGDEVPDDAVALGFDAYLLAIDAIEKAGTADDGQLIVDALNNLETFQGASGTIRFDAQGDPERSVTIRGNNGGTLQTAYIVSPED